MIFAISFLLSISFSLFSSLRSKILTGLFPVIGTDEVFTFEDCIFAPISLSDICTH